MLNRYAVNSIQIYNRIRSISNAWVNPNDIPSHKNSNGMEIPFKIKLIKKEVRAARKAPPYSAPAVCGKTLAWGIAMQAI